jgi:hypothetical protein
MITAQHSGATADQHQNKGTDKFRQKLTHITSPDHHKARSHEIVKRLTK